MSIENLARPEIRNLKAYENGLRAGDGLRLNANEAPESTTTGDSRNSLNRYPEIRPTELQSRLSGYFGVCTENLLVTRGSSEAIDLLIRTFCRSGQDNIVTTPPTFAMYGVYADIQGAETITNPLLPEQGFVLDTESLKNACNERSKLVFICSPNNPSGNVVPRQKIMQLLQARHDKSLVVVDEAYIEFSGSASMVDQIGEYDNLVILRTLSKALALAGARCGAVIGNATLIRMLNSVLAPYALATPVVDCVMRTLDNEADAAGQLRIRQIIAERERLRGRLAENRWVRHVWPSQANFLLVRFHDLAAIQERLQTEGILIRDFSGHPGLEECARITVGAVDENTRLLAALH